MGDEILIGRSHVSEQDMQNALRGAFLEGFKEGVSVSQRSLFANVYIEHLLRTEPNRNPTDMAEAAFAFADIVVACGRPKKQTQQ
jgi:hypothetical protein